MIKVGHIKRDQGIRVDTWSGSPLGNPFYREPRSVSIPKYRQWLWSQMQIRTTEQVKELNRLVNIYKQDGEITLLCWCAPKPCHADVVKAVLEWMMAVPK